MLTFKRKFWDAVLSGEKTQTLRIWKVLRLRANQKSFAPGIGSIWIDSIEEVTFDQLTDADAIPDGFSSLEALRNEILNIYGPEPIGKLYRVRFHLLPPEPRDPLGPKPVFSDSLKSMGVPELKTSASENAGLKARVSQVWSVLDDPDDFVDSVDPTASDVSGDSADLVGLVEPVSFAVPVTSAFSADSDLVGFKPSPQKKKTTRTKRTKKVSTPSNDAPHTSEPSVLDVSSSQMPASAGSASQEAVSSGESVISEEPSAIELWESWGFFKSHSISQIEIQKRREAMEKRRASSARKRQKKSLEDDLLMQAIQIGTDKELPKSVLDYAARIKRRLEMELSGAPMSQLADSKLESLATDLKPEISTVPMLTESEVVEKMLRKCRIHRNVCDWNHEPGKSQDFFALFMQAPRDERGIPKLNGLRLRTLMRAKVSDSEWDEICWIAAEICEAWNEWQYAVEHWLFPRKAEEK